MKLNKAVSMKIKYLCAAVWLLAGISFNGYALEEAKSMQSPHFERLLILDLDASHDFTVQEVFSGLDGFIAQQIPPDDLAKMDKSAMKNIFKDADHNTYIGLSSFDQLRSLDSDHNYQLDVYDPLYTRLVISSYNLEGGFLARKLSDVGIISINIPAVPTAEEFQAKKVNGATISGKAIEFPKPVSPRSL